MATTNCSKLTSASRARVPLAPAQLLPLSSLRVATAAAPSLAPCMRGRLATAHRLRARGSRSPSRTATDASVRSSSSHDSYHLDRSCYLLAEQQLRMWLGVSENAEMDFHREALPIRHTTTQVHAATLRVTAGERSHAVACLVVPLGPAGDASPLQDGVLVHWGTVRRLGDRWRPPAAGWHTYPEISRDGGGGAWQTLMAQHEVGGEDVLVMMLQLPLEGPVAEGGLAFVLKTGQQQWLGDASTYKDFFLRLADLPEMQLGGEWEPEGGHSADELAGDLARSRMAAMFSAQGPEQPLDFQSLARGKANKRHHHHHQQEEKVHRHVHEHHHVHEHVVHHEEPQAHQEQQHHHQEQQHHHQEQQQQQQPKNDAPPSDFGGLAGRRQTYSGPDSSQQCTLTAAQLHRAAEHQLKCFMDTQDDLVLPAGRMRVQQSAFSLQGHPGTPFVVATAVTRSQEGKPVLCLSAIADGGVTGNRTPGLVLAYGAATGNQGGVQPLPWGWKSWPELTWDAGEGWWELPFTRELLQPGALALEGHNGSYMCCLRLSLEGPLIEGGLQMYMSSGNGRRHLDGATGQNLFLHTAPLAFEAQLGDDHQHQEEEEEETQGYQPPQQEQQQQEEGWGQPTLKSSVTSSNPYRQQRTQGVIPDRWSSYAKQRQQKQQQQQEAPKQPEDPWATNDSSSSSSSAGATQQAEAPSSSSSSSWRSSSWRTQPPPQQQRPADDVPTASDADVLPPVIPDRWQRTQQEEQPAPSSSSSDRWQPQIADPWGSLAPAPPRQQEEPAWQPYTDSTQVYEPTPPPSPPPAASSSRDEELPAAPLSAAMSAAGASQQELAELAAMLQELRERDAAAAAAAAQAPAADAKQARAKRKEQEEEDSKEREAARLAAFLRDFQRTAADGEQLVWGRVGTAQAPGVAWDTVDHLAHREHDAERSLMHRYNIAADMLQGLLGQHHGGGWVGGNLLAVGVWLRLSAARLLTWNRNYNVKPREISVALQRVNDTLVQFYESAPDLRGVVLMAMAAAGRGGDGDMGQRVRDEILVIQSRNNCKGGMMEEWHQKLHNNSSPDDIGICKALLAMLNHPQLSVSAYWDALAAEGISRERLASYDRSIRSEPHFTPDQAPQLKADLEGYLLSLQAVHGGDDLKTAAAVVLGYEQKATRGGQHGNIKVAPVPGVDRQQLQQLVDAVLHLQGSSGGEGGASSIIGKKIESMLAVERCLKGLQLVAAAERLLQPALRGGQGACGGRLKDVLFLQLALQSTGRMLLEGGLQHLRRAAPSTLLGGLLALVLGGLEAALGSAAPGQLGNQEAVACLQQLEQLATDAALEPQQKALQVLAVFERLQGWLMEVSNGASAWVQPVADALGGKLGCDGHAVGLMAEEVVRGSPLAALAQLLTALEPRLCALAEVNPWSILSRDPTKVVGQLVRVAALADVQTVRYATPTLLVCEHLGGEEEIPPGVVGVVLLGSCPDVLCHAAVRARNGKIPLVCSRAEDMGEVVAPLVGQPVTLTIQGGDVNLTLAPEGALEAGEAGDGATSSEAAGALVRAGEWTGQWVMQPGHYQKDQVGAKSLATGKLQQLLRSTEGGQRKLPAWCHSPSSVTLPYGVYQAVMAHPVNESVRGRLDGMLRELRECKGEEVALQLQLIRSLVQQLVAPPELQQELAGHLANLRLPLATPPHLAPSPSWAESWEAIKAVWGSQWNARAQLALLKASIPVDALAMAVLVQPVVPVSYAWVAHTFNPTNGNMDEVYVELVAGLGEVLVGSYPGRSLGAVLHKPALLQALAEGSTWAESGAQGVALPPGAPRNVRKLVKVVSHLSKRVAFKAPGAVLPGEMRNSGSSSPGVVPRSLALMMRSDSNAEDLPGFAGAGLFDSLPTTPAEEVVMDYSREPLASDQEARLRLLWQIGLASVAVEVGLGEGPQDVEGGVARDGSIWVLQSRPQV